jgi:lipocalin
VRALRRRVGTSSWPAATLAGTWWELATPAREARGPVAHARSLTLSLRPDGWFDVVTRWRAGSSSGPWREQVGVARLDTSPLGVSLWLREGPFRWRERIIAARAADDAWLWLLAPLGGAAWLLARAPTLDGEAWPAALTVARALAIEPADLVLSPRGAATVTWAHGEAR